MGHGTGIVRRGIAVAVCAVAALGLWLLVQSVTRPPAATTPEGAYVLLTRTLSDGRDRDAYDLLDDPTRSACEDIVATAGRVARLVLAHFPEAQRESTLARYAPLAHGGDAAELWLDEAERNGWLQRLRSDLSGVAAVEREADRAVVVTVGGTRYPFSRRADGNFGLSAFGTELLRLRDRLAGDAALVEEAAQDYERSAL